MMKTLFAILFFALLIPCAHAQQAIDKLTHDNVEEFIKQTNEMTVGKGGPEGASQVKDYLSLHIRDDAQFTSRMTYDIPGQQQQDAQMSLSKADFLAGLESGEKSLKSYNSDITIRKIKIAPNKKSATAVTETHDAITMPMQKGDDGLQDVPLDGISTCEQTIALSDLGIIQMAGAHCETKISVEP